MTDTEITQKYSLKKLSHDGRDILYGSLFGSLPTPADLPAEFLVGTKDFLKDQTVTDFCSAFSSTEVSEDQEGVELDPLWQFMKMKVIEGDPQSYGCDLRSAGMSFVKFGSIEQSQSPYNVGTARQVIVDPSKWMDKPYDAMAEKHKKASFAFVTGAYDAFDNIRTTMYHAAQVFGIEQSVFAGFDWCLEYNVAKDGVVTDLGRPIGGHAIKLKGWKMIEGEPFIVAQLSQGKSFGNNGYLYFSRNVVNAQDGYGAVTFLPVPKKMVQAHADAGAFLDSNFVWRWIQLLLNKIFHDSI